MRNKLILLFWISLPVLTVYIVLLTSSTPEYEVVLEDIPKIEGAEYTGFKTPFDITVVDANSKPISSATVLFTEPELHQGISDADGVARTTFYDVDQVKVIAYARGYIPSDISAVANHQRLVLHKKPKLPQLEAPLPEIFPRSLQIISASNHSLANGMILVRPRNKPDAEPFIYFADASGRFELAEVSAIDLDCKVYDAGLPATNDTLLGQFTIDAGQEELVFDDLATQLINYTDLPPNTLYRLSGNDFIALIRSDVDGNIEIGPLPANVDYSIKLNR